MTSALRKVKVMVAVGSARLTSLLLVVTLTVGVMVSTVKLGVLPARPGLPLISCQLFAVTDTFALLMLVSAFAVKVAV
jgi:hypothetical protein